MPEYQKFESVNLRPKPTAFNLLRVDVRPDKDWSFDDMLQDNQKGLKRQALVESKSLDDVETRLKAERQLTRELSALTSGTKFLSAAQKLDIELVATRLNRERFKEDTYLSKDHLKGLLPGGNLAVSVAGADEARRRRLAESDDDDDTVSENDEYKDGDSNTFIHNATLYGRLDTHNPFREGAMEEYRLFGEYFSDLDLNFVSGLFGLERRHPDLKQQITDTVAEIIDRFSSRAVQGVSDPYFNDIESYDLNMDWYDVFTAPAVFNNLSDNERFSVVMSAYDDLSRYHLMSSNMFGSGVDTTDGLEVLNRASPIHVLDRIVTNEDEALDRGGVSDPVEDSLVALPTGVPELEKDVVSDPIESSRLTAESSLEAAQIWWETVGQHIKNPGKLIAAGLVPEVVDSISNLTNWGQFNISSDNEAAFNDPRRVFVEGYFDYFDRQYLDGFASDRRISLNQFSVDNLYEAEQVYDALVQNRYIASDGRITPQFDYANPKFEFDLGLSDELEEKAYNVLASELLGEFSFDRQDYSFDVGSEKKAIRIRDSQGNYVDLGTLVDQIGSGQTYEEKMASTRNVYDTALSLYMSMVGLDATNTTTGDVQSTPLSAPNGAGQLTETDYVQVALHGDAQWLEWNEQQTSSKVLDADGKWITVYEGGWDTHSGKPLVLKFQNDVSAQQFADKMLELTQLLAPVLGMFSQENLKVLMTDQLSLNVGEEPRFMLHEFRSFNSPVYNEAHNYIRNSIGHAIGYEIFDDAQTNRLTTSRHRQKRDDYYEAKEEHDIEEYHRLVREYRRIAERRKERKKVLQRFRSERIKQEREQNRQIAERRKAYQKSRIEQLKSRRRSQATRASANKAKA